MKQRVKSRRSQASARNGLRRRVMQWYDRFNRRRWADCYKLIDPRLRSAERVNESTYAQSLEAFHNRYGEVRTWHVRISLHLSPTRASLDNRPFAYVYTVWQDGRHDFHMFRERWVLDGDRWYTRVAGLVVNAAQSNAQP